MSHFYKKKQNKTKQKSKIKACPVGSVKEEHCEIFVELKDVFKKRFERAILPPLSTNKNADHVTTLKPKNKKMKCKTPETRASVLCAF
jgi:hypothetical protein